ncbi:pentatricopeptide repeat-containing protein At1g80270, mitochondrial-like [Papaver somniferum]|uniref:pentatricopeptide repeat-containing protein At1g80270, mitochondrial-like n=1 Tax=Papaver somniferum TaxID=3469 RepID=UPI000E6FC870|nr:pentatricopeptide repeat-containing protein At1g80270, mitochondrial-like [Papaver somniferum]XP_026423856.1 pentatricopeptide repeat-containing protein At1g80270, mitochondrial-like [Papaver somniferum]XP_026423857.1 pentatricopeptide repeat-containing protein At1g80270, mitochondrial-like [Papaver somniferum]XP_026423858.1 pentatricopeptide repeat-containing protein At1g80270, mitochondrial-like [Papaver somniferum]
MFTLRRASISLRTRLHSLRAVAGAAAAPPQSYHTKSNNLHQISPEESNNLHQDPSNHRNLLKILGVDRKEDKEEDDVGEDLRDGFSELENPPKDEEDPEKVRSPRFNLFYLIASAHPRNLYASLNKFIPEIKALGNSKIRKVFHRLSGNQMYELAYQLSNWLEIKNLVTFEEERDYATRLDLIAKVSGLPFAEKYLDESIPEMFKGEKVYKTLLYNHIKAGNAKRAEQVFEKMRNLGFPVSGYACEQMIALYRKFDKKKIANVLLLMDENDVKPTRFTYQILIDVKGKSNDTPGMEELVQDMKNDGLELDDHIRSVLARHYIYAGFDMKAGEILKEMETEDLEVKFGECNHLLPLYAALGKADQVERIWKLCESDGRVDDDVAGISAFGKVGRVEKAEEIFEKSVKSSSKGYIALLNVYVDHKLVAKCEDLVKRMTSARLPIDPILCYSLVKFYVDAGEVEKADSVLQNALQQGDRRLKPSYKSFQLMMNQYSTRGDIHNTEKIFHHLKQTGYVSNIGDYQSLLQAYINGKVPAYGFRERIMADNLIPDKFFDVQLADVHPFKKTAMSSDLLDLENILS